MRAPSLSLALLLLLSVPLALSTAGCATPRASGLELDELADRLASKEVVFLGELHDNVHGHQIHRRLLEELHERRPDLVLSMEMFERDVQVTLDLYLTGVISEEVFLESSRPWKNYARDYRPLVEYARENRLQVVAANIPTKLARRAVRQGKVSIEGDPHAAETSTAPRDIYWERFLAALGEHADHGADGGDDMLYRTYVAQCLRDDTMAESIVRALDAAEAEGRKPLVVHVTGQFHVDLGLGTVERVLQRRPGTAHAIVEMEVVEGIVPGPRADIDYTLRVAPPPPKEKAAAKDGGATTRS